MLPLVTLIALSSLEDASKFLLLHFRLSWRDESILFLRIPRAIPQSKGCMLPFDNLGSGQYSALISTTHQIVHGY